jgi:hypothetical protein
MPEEKEQQGGGRRAAPDAKGRTKGVFGNSLASQNSLLPASQIIASFL